MPGSNPHTHIKYSGFGPMHSTIRSYGIHFKAPWINPAAVLKCRINFRQYSKSTDFICVACSESTYKLPAEERIHFLDTRRLGNNSIPLVILLGTAQTIETYSPHISALSKHRRVIIPELRGQGKTQLNSTYATMEQHVTDFCDFMKALDVQ